MTEPRPRTREHQSSCVDKEHSDNNQTQHDAKKIEYMDYKNCNTAPNTRPVTTDEQVRANIKDDRVDDEDLRLAFILRAHHDSLA